MKHSLYIRFCIPMLFGILFVCGQAEPAITQQHSPIEITSRVDKSRITIGDLVHYEIVLTHKPDVKVTWPALGSNLGAFEIRDYQVEDPVKQKGQVIEKISYTISTFDTGAYTIPPLEIKYALSPDTTQLSLRTEPIDIYVASLRPSLAGDIRGLKPQGILPRDWKIWLLYGGLGLLVVLLAVGGWLFIRYRKKGELPFVKKPPPLPAHQVALEALRKLQQARLLEMGEVKEHYSRLSEILRGYVEARYFFPALESTTLEVVEHFSRDGQLGDQLPALEKILELCDLVKFAKYQPDAGQAEESMALSFQFIEATKPIFESIEEEKGTAGEEAPTEFVAQGEEGDAGESQPAEVNTQESAT